MLGNELEDAEVVDNPEVVGDQPPQPQPQPLPVVPAVPAPPEPQPAQPPRPATPIININFIGNVSRANQELVSQLLATGQLPAGFAAPPTPPPTPPPALARPHPGPMRNRAAQPQMPWEGAQAPAPPARRGPGRPPGRRSTGGGWMAALANLGHSLPPNGASVLAAMAAVAGPARASVPLAVAGPQAQAPLPFAGPQAQAPLAVAAAGPSQPALEDPPANRPQAQAPLAEAGPSQAPGVSATSTCMVCRCPRDELGIITKCGHLLCVECKNALLRRGGVGQCPNGYCHVMFQESDFLVIRT